jgi:hypothetical protein
MFGLNGGAWRNCSPRGGCGALFSGRGKKKGVPDGVHAVREGGRGGGSSGRHPPGAGGGGWCGTREEWGTNVWDPSIVLGGRVKPSLNPFKWSNFNSNNFQIHSNVDRSKHDLHKLEKFERKYDFEWFEERNNFLHRNFFRFEVNFE